MSQWGDLAVWRPTDAHGGAMAEHRGLVVHIAEGFYEGTIGYQHDTANQVSSHFVVGRGMGQIAQCVDTDQQSWAQRAGNSSWLSVECEGFTLGHRLNPSHPGWEELTTWQIQAIARLLVRAHQQYGIPLQLATDPAGRGLGHHSMGGPDWGHIHCPGDPIIAQKPIIVATARPMLGITPAPAPAPQTETEKIMGQLPTLQHGASGTPVRRVQALCNADLGGADIAEDGVFGPVTTAAVKHVQSAGRLTQDGIVGPHTWAVLLGVAS